jgi:hypothetical protein
MNFPLRVTYRAIMHAPKAGPLNQMGLTIAVSLEVEVYPVADGMWKWRVFGAPKNKNLEKLAASPSYEAAQNNCRALFQKQESPWVMWGDPLKHDDEDAMNHGKEYRDKVRPIQPDEIVRREGKVFLKKCEKAQAAK